MDLILELPPTLRAAHVARVITMEALAAIGLHPSANRVGLLASELATNAVRHGGTSIRLRLTIEDDGALTMQVSDRGPGEPVAPDPGGGGHGLLIVERTASRCGWFPHVDQPGKTVWATSGPQLFER
jgi:anti-sigma regulatory factor (Ser/Thr protein kinase)